MNERLVFSSQHLVVAESVRQVLALEGIQARLRHVELGSTLGGVAIADASVEVVVAPEEEDRARAVLDALWRKGTVGESDVPCSVCGAPLTPALAVCWECGAVQPDVASSHALVVEPPRARTFSPYWAVVFWFFVAFSSVSLLAWLLHTYTRFRPTLD